jgi:MoaA/NifB/PqqE/SkfB family radical SAM enzyme
MPTGHQGKMFKKKHAGNGKGISGKPGFPESPRILFLAGWGPEQEIGGRKGRRMEDRAVCAFKGLPRRARLLIRGSFQSAGCANPRLRVSARTELLGEREIHPGVQCYDFPIRRHDGAGEVAFELRRSPASSSADEESRPGLVVERMEVLTERATSIPSVLEIESSTRCNISPPCVMCYPRIFDKRRYFGDLSDAAFNSLVPFLKGFKTISLHGVGEPLLGGKLMALLDNIDRENTWVQFNSNGLLLTEEMSRELISKKLKMIDFSLDAATRETYRKIRRSDFDRAVGNIERLSRIKRELGVKHPVIKVNMTLMKENESEIVAFVDLAKVLGAGIIHLGLLNPTGNYQIRNGEFVFDYHDQMVDPKSPAFRIAFENAQKKARDFGIEFIAEFSGYYA